MSPAHVLGLAVLIACMAVAYSQHMQATSTLLGRFTGLAFREDGQAASSITCSSVLLHGATTTNTTTVYEYGNVMALLSAHARDRTSISKLNDTLRVGGELFSTFFAASMANGIPPVDHAGRRYTLQLMKINMTQPSTLLCLEMELLQKRFDVLMPITEAGEMTLTANHNVDFLEEHFGIPCIIPPISAIIVFMDKQRFVEWVTSNTLGQFLPTVYLSPETVLFPAVVKRTNMNGGIGVYIVQNHAELVNALAAVGDAPYLLQEAIESSIEISPNFIAYRGELLGMFCAINKQRSQLTVVAMVDDESEKNYPIDCGDLENISPLYDMTKRIVQLSNYNGFGVINMKLAPGRMSRDALESYLTGVQTIDKGSVKAVATDFTSVKSSDDTTIHDAIPKMFEINARIGGPLYSTYPIQFTHMIELYAHRAYKATHPI